MSTTREQWLLEATELLRPWYDEVDKPLPEKVRVSVGWGKRSGKAIGVCYKSIAAEDGIHQIFLSPTLIEPVAPHGVLDTLVHELVHAADDGQSGHKGEFRRVARALGLEGKLISTYGGEALLGRLEPVAKELGEYPHALLDPNQITKQSTRMLKVVCLSCEFSFRTSKKWVEYGLPPQCSCGGELELSL